MNGVVGTEPLARGYETLASGDWEAAREAFAEAVEASDSPEALDGLGRALWCFRHERQAIVHRERACAGFRRDGDLARAARIALWLSREYALVFGNEAAARGWLLRAERLLKDVAPGSEQGWLDLARSEGVRDLETAAHLAASALRVALDTSDADLELRALAQLGFIEVSLGRVDEGLAHLDEAMSAATSGEPAALETFADVCCLLMRACERAGDVERPRQWSSVLEEFVRAYEHVMLLAFCRTCCADVYAANGRIDAAEEELVAALRELTEAGQRSRCAHPAARLAEIRVHQGRLEEAEQLLAGLEHQPDVVRAAAIIRLARGEPAAAALLLETRIAELGPEIVLAAPFLELLVLARLAELRVEAAREAAVGAEAVRVIEPSLNVGEEVTIASGPFAGLLAVVSRVMPGRERVAAMAALARGRIALAQGDDAAPALLRAAVNGFAALGLRLDAARARLELARALRSESPQVAVDTARQARKELEALGAGRDADAAAAFIRSLGAREGTAPRSAGLLTGREKEVLALLAQGLSNRQIGERLCISPKTAEHHVGRILGKLGLKTRAEAAAWAARHSGPE